jgi:polar amino acid transport system permease protein
MQSHTEDMAAAPIPVVASRIHWGQWIGGVAAVAFLVMVGMVVGSSQNVEWAEIPAFMLNPAILSGIAVTLELTVMAMAIGIALGTLLAAMKMAPNPVLNWIARAYIWFFRGVPLLVQIFVWFNIALFVPTIHLGAISISTNTIVTTEVAGLLALALHEAANMAEIVRAGILSVEAGQQEASLALGLTRRQAMRRIVLPQAVKVILPPTGNQAIGMLKGSAAVSVIGMHDLLTQAQLTYARNYLVIEMLFVAAIWYLVMTSVASVGQRYLESYFQNDARKPSRPLLLARLRASLAGSKSGALP